MIYYMTNIIVYTISIVLAMIGLSCFRFDDYIKKTKVKEFYIFYVMAAISLGYLFASFILSFGTMSAYL